MTVKEAVWWLINEMNPETKHDGCSDYRSDYGCNTCKEQIEKLNKIKTMFGIT